MGTSDGGASIESPKLNYVRNCESSSDFSINSISENTEVDEFYDYDTATTEVTKNAVDEERINYLNDTMLTRYIAEFRKSSASSTLHCRRLHRLRDFSALQDKWQHSQRLRV